MSSVFDSREYILYIESLSSLESLWEEKESLDREPIFPCAEKALESVTAMTGQDTAVTGHDRYESQQLSLTQI